MIICDISALFGREAMGVERGQFRQTNPFLKIKTYYLRYLWTTVYELKWPQ
jgi:hypothetical protein